METQPGQAQEEKLADKLADEENLSQNHQELAAKLKELEELVRCVDCQRVLEDPRTFPCQHSVCGKCFDKEEEEEEEASSRQCPKCKCGFETAKSFGATHVDFAPSRFLTKLLKTPALSVQDSQINKKCSVCPKMEAALYCVDCPMYFCVACEAMHNKFPAFKLHKVIGKHDIKYEFQRRPTPCDQEHHFKLPLDQYCHQCNVIACKVCIATTHVGHSNMVEIKQAEADERATMGFGLEKVSFSPSPCHFLFLVCLLTLDNFSFLFSFHFRCAGKSSKSLTLKRLKM